MNKRTGLYLTAGVDAAACGVLSQAGGVALLETARVSGRVASDPTVSRLIDMLAADAPRAFAAISTARAAARAVIWEAAGRHAPDHEVSGPW